MMLLAIDTSTAQVGIALADGEQLAVESIWNTNVHHTIELAPAVAALLERTALGMTSVTAVGVAVGPGSFTALRVGLAMAKGLALARRIPIIGVPTLDVLAAGQPFGDVPLACVLRAGRERLAVGWYRAQGEGHSTDAAESHSGLRRWLRQGQPEVMTVESLAKSITKPCMIAGELSAEDRARLARKRVNVVLAPVNLCVRRPSVLAEIALERLRSGHVDDPATLTPIYIHQAEPVPA